MQSNTEQEILRLEETLRQDEMAVDVAALDAIYADDIMVTAPVGVVVDKTAVLAELRLAASKATVEQYDKEDVQVRAYGDTAVTSYRMRVKARYEGQEISRQFRITNVWMKRQGRWQIVARHTASIEQPAAAQGTA